MAKPKILIQLDTDAQPSVFDAIVAIDAGAEQLLRHGGVRPEQVRELVYGGMFTRSPGDLSSTAVFVGGSNVAAAEMILAEVQKTYFGPLRMSVLLDASGANTTAAAAVLAASKHISLSKAKVLVLAATGPVGSRVVRLLAGRGAIVCAASRDLGRAEAVCQATRSRVENATVEPCLVTNPDHAKRALAENQLVVSAGPPGVMLLPAEVRAECKTLKVAIDLNAVPPMGIQGIVATDSGERDGIIAYGALGLGALKMKIHKRAIQRIFESNDQILDAEEVLALGESLQ